MQIVRVMVIMTIIIGFSTVCMHVYDCICICIFDMYDIEFSHFGSANMSYTRAMYTRVNDGDGLPTFHRSKNLKISPRYVSTCLRKQWCPR